MAGGSAKSEANGMYNRLTWRDVWLVHWSTQLTFRRCTTREVNHIHIIISYERTANNCTQVTVRSARSR